MFSREYSPGVIAAQHHQLGVVVEAALGQAASVLKRADLVYADPPYDVEFTKYSREDFTRENQARFAGWLAEHPGPVVVSNQATRAMIELYLDRHFTVVQLFGPRRISRNGDRTPAREVLALKGVSLPLEQGEIFAVHAPTRQPRKQHGQPPEPVALLDAS